MKKNTNVLYNLTFDHFALINFYKNIKLFLTLCFSDTGKTKADVKKDRFMVNQENERPDQQRRSAKHDIVPTWDEVHKGQLISKAIIILW